MQKYSHPVIFVLETIKFKEKYNTEASITFNAGSGDDFLPAVLGPTVLITEAGQPHHCPSHQYCRQETSRVWGSSPAPTLISQRVVGMGRHSAFASFKMASTGSGFSVSLEKFWSQCQTGSTTSWAQGPRISASRLLPLEITDLQRLLFNLKEWWTVYPIPREKVGHIPWYSPPTPTSFQHTHTN